MIGLKPRISDDYFNNYLQRLAIYPRKNKATSNPFYVSVKIKHASPDVTLDVFHKIVNNSLF